MEGIPNQHYHATLIGSQVLRDELTKIYFAHFIGRESIAYSWEGKDELTNRLVEGIRGHVRSSLYKGVPHIAVAFPHITSLYRFGDPRLEDERETNLYVVGRGNTSSGEKIRFLRNKSEDAQLGGLFEISPLVAAEMEYWADSHDVFDYLTRRIKPNLSLIVRDSNKLRRYLESMGYD